MRFIDFTDLEFITKLFLINNLDQIVSNSEEEMVKKKNKRMTKRKKRLAKLYAFVESLLFSCLKSSLFLLPYFVLISVPIFITTLVSCLVFLVVALFCYILTTIIYSGSSAILLSYCIPAPVSCSIFPIVLFSYCVSTLTRSATFFLLCHAFISYCRISALLMLLSMLNPPLPFRFSSLRTLTIFVRWVLFLCVN